jgi:serine/threonine protein kinase
MGTYSSSSGDPTQSWVGVRLMDRYVVLSVLGSGRLGTVYLASDARRGRTVAIKAPHLRLVPAASWRERFESEMLALTAWSHPGIVQILDVGAHLGHSYVVSRFLGGGSLETRLVERGGRLLPLEILEWLPGIAKALDHVHRRGRLHGDVWIGNLLFDGHGIAQLSDLGFAAALSDPNTGLSATGDRLVPPEAPPPEALAGKFGPASDQYGLAALVWRCLGGSLPLSPRMALASPQAPEKLTQAVLRGLASEPRDRFSSCFGLARAFERGLQRSHSPARPAASTAPAAATRPSLAVGPALLDAVLVALVLAIGLGGASWVRFPIPSASGAPPVSSTSPAARAVALAPTPAPTASPTAPPTPTEPPPTAASGPTETATPRPPDPLVRPRSLARSGKLAEAAALFEAAAAGRPGAFAIELTQIARDSTAKRVFGKAPEGLGLWLFSNKPKARWALCVGPFESQELATQAVQRLPELFDGQEPRVRTLAQILVDLR